MVNPVKLFLSIVFVFFPLGNAAYNVVDFGAKGDGKTDSTRAFLSAWNSACSSTTPTQIFVPQGRFLIGQVEFRGPCKNNAITIRIEGTLVAPSDYRALGTSSNWILFIKVTGVSVYGGTLDGQGASFWACLKSGKRCPDGTRSLTFNYASNVVISGLTSINSKASHIVINECQNVMVQGLKIVAPDDSPNTDGIHVQISKGVTIVGTSIKTGDDCVSIGPGAANLLIERVDCGPGHGISIGSLGKDAMEPGVQNVTVKNVIFTGTQNGLRIKSWARPSSGFVQGVLYQDAVMNNVQNPIIIDQNYCPRDQGCPGQESATWRQLKERDVDKVIWHQLHMEDVLDINKLQHMMRARIHTRTICSKNQPTGRNYFELAQILAAFHNLNGRVEELFHIVHTKQPKEPPHIDKEHAEQQKISSDSVTSKEEVKSGDYVTMTKFESLLKREMSQHEDADLSYDYRPPYPIAILEKPYLKDYVIPKFTRYNGKNGNAKEHISRFIDALSEKAYTWYSNLEPGRINTWEEMVKVFFRKFFLVEEKTMLIDLSREQQKSTEGLIEIRYSKSF